jgi:threonine/homoserine/homoserine lactone efflux protein
MTFLLGAFVATCFIVELTPGPNIAYLAILSTSKGRRAGYAATAGVAVGLLIVGVAAAAGLTALIKNSPVLYEALRWVGVVYLLWLAYEGWRGEDEHSEGHASDPSIRTYFMRGLWTNLLNPKAGMFYAAILPTFIQESLPIMSQAMALTLLYVTIATGVHTGVVTIAGSARSWLEHENRAKLARRLLSVMLAAIAVWLLIATRR